MQVAYQRPASLYKAGSPISNAANQIRPGVRQTGALTQTVRGTRFTDTRVSPGKSLYNSPSRGLQAGGVAGQPAPYSRLPVKGPNLSASQERAFSGFNNKLPSWADPKSPATVNPNPAPTPKPPPIQSVPSPPTRGIPLGRLAGLGIGSALAGGLDVARRLNEGQSISEAVTGGAGTGLGSLAGSALGGALGSSLGPIGTLAGAGLGGALGGLLGGKAGDLISGVERATDPRAPKTKQVSKWEGNVGEGEILAIDINYTGQLKSIFFDDPFPPQSGSVNGGNFYGPLTGFEIRRVNEPGQFYDEIFITRPALGTQRYTVTPAYNVSLTSSANVRIVQGPKAGPVELPNSQIDYPTPQIGGLIFVPQLNPQQFPASTPQITGPQSPGIPRPVASPAKQREAEKAKNPLLETLPDPREGRTPYAIPPGLLIPAIQPSIQRTAPGTPSTQPSTIPDGITAPPGGGVLPPNPANPTCRNPCEVATLNGIDATQGQVQSLQSQVADQGRKLDQLNALLNGLDLAGNAAIMAKLNAMDNKLGPQIPGGGISGFIRKTWNFLQVDRALNVLTWIGVVHNAYMLSNNIAQTLFSAVSNGLAVAGIKDDEDNPLDIGEIVTKWTDSYFKNLFGVTTWEGIKSTWKKLNRILSAATSLLQSIQSIGYSILQSLEVVGSWVAQIGNAARKYGVVWENAFGWMNPNINFTTNRFFNALNNTQEAVENIDEITSELLSVQETGAQLAKQVEDLDKAAKGLDIGGLSPDKPKPGDHASTTTTERDNKSSSQGATINAGDEAKP